MLNLLYDVSIILWPAYILMLTEMSSIPALLTTGPLFTPSVQLWKFLTLLGIILLWAVKFDIFIIVFFIVDAFFLCNSIVVSKSQIFIILHVISISSKRDRNGRLSAACLLLNASFHHGRDRKGRLDGVVLVILLVHIPWPHLRPSFRTHMIHCNHSAKCHNKYALRKKNKNKKKINIIFELDIFWNLSS